MQSLLRPKIKRGDGSVPWRRRSGLALKRAAARRKMFFSSFSSHQIKITNRLCTE
jgi:hypothetical protein